MQSKSKAIGSILSITFRLYVASILAMKYNKPCQALISDENKHNFWSETWKSLITFFSFIYSDPRLEKA
jgi:hypothetical protein